MFGNLLISELDYIGVGVREDILSSAEFASTYCALLHRCMYPQTLIYQHEL
jgi:hypothetical protein